MKEISKTVTVHSTVRIMDDGIHCAPGCPFIKRRPRGKITYCMSMGIFTTPLHAWITLQEDRDNEGLFFRHTYCIEAEARNEESKNHH